MKKITQKVSVLSAVMALMLITVTMTSCETPVEPTNCADKPDPTLVQTQDGLLRGQANKAGNAYEFLGIPYAKPPVGELRWKAPQDPESWEGERSAVEFGSTCPQAPTPFGVGSANEDCLFLNVTTPNPCGSRPVMVWIHGGAFIAGSGSEKGYDPTRLVEQGVVVVTLNYRLGALGFLPLSELADENGDAGTWGVMDQQKALQWVRDNIAAFGGDPKNVTIFGESAGGHSVYTHIASPKSKGLFNKAISESGAYFITQPTLADGRKAFGNPFLTRANISEDDPQLLDKLHEMPVADILAAQGADMYVPVTGGPVLPKSVFDAVTAGEYNNVPVISGCNLNEGRLFTALEVLKGNTMDTEEEYTQSVVSLLVQFPMEIDANAVATRYIDKFKDSGDNMYRLAYSQIFTDAMFATTNFYLWTTFKTVYAYWFTDDAAPSDFNDPAGIEFEMNASHMDEIQYVFGTVQGKSGVTDAQKKLSNEMIGYWTNFAKNGAPASTSYGSSSWKAFKPGAMQGLNGDVKQFDTPSKNVKGSQFISANSCLYWGNLLMP